MRSALSPAYSVAAFIVLLLAASVSAQAPALQLSMMDADDPGPTEWTPTGSDNGDESFNFVGSRTADHWVCEWNIDAKADPWISAVVTLTNNTAFTQTYTFVSTLPIAPITLSTLHAGSMQGGLTDNSYDSIDGTITTDSVSGDPLFYGLIDGSPVLSIYPDSTSYSAPFDGGSVSIPAMNVGYDGFGNPTLASGPALVSIGIQHRFTLTPGDSATFTSHFVVVPEPATMTMLAVGSTLLLWRRRR
jgi:hypothetical protein